MFNKIMVPVDLEHQDRLTRALQCAADLATTHDAEVCFLGATTETPGPLGHSPAEYDEKLKAFAVQQAGAHGIKTSHHMVVAHDLTIELDADIIKAVKQSGADLVVMATHTPGLKDYIWSSNGGKIAMHSAASVFLVRG